MVYYKQCSPNIKSAIVQFYKLLAIIYKLSPHSRKFNATWAEISQFMSQNTHQKLLSYKGQFNQVEVQYSTAGQGCNESDILPALNKKHEETYEKRYWRQPEY